MRRASLYMTDGEIAAELGVTAASFVATAATLERDGFPRPDPLFANRRYWPAVRAYLDRRAGIAQSSPQALDGEENWNERPNEQRRRARA